MRLLRHQRRNHAEDGNIGHDAVAQRGHFVFFLRNAVGKIEDDADFGDLRRLELDGSETDPALCAVRQSARADARDQNEHQQDDGKDQQHLRHRAIALVIDLADNKHRRDTEDRKNALTDEVVRGVTLFIVGRGETGGKQHDQAHAHERKHQQKIRKVQRSAARFARRRLDGLRPLALLLPQQAFFLGHAVFPLSY